MKTTMDKLAVGAIFTFTAKATAPRLVKVSNMYARDERGVMRPNANKLEEAAVMEVYYWGREGAQMDPPDTLPHTCSACGRGLNGDDSLGYLGPLTWYRCRGCGMNTSR